MKQLSGLDAAFLHMETATTFGHVTGLMIFEPPAGEFAPYAAVHAKYSSLVGELEPLRRRLVEVPFGLDHPYWVFDPKFDLDYHVRELNLARPGSDKQLSQQISRIVGRPLDRSRPLWEVYVIDGLTGRRWALLTKYHHATVDGANGQLMLDALTDTSAEAPPPEPGPEWKAEPLPGRSALLGRALGNLAANPLKAARTQARIVRQLADSAGIHSVSGAATQAGAVLKRIARLGTSYPSRISLPNISAPPTPWNREISGHRRFAMCSASFDDVKRIKNVTGATINDVVMAVCAGALREYLLVHDALPDRPLSAMVPISVRTGDEADPWTNRVSATVAELPTDCNDPMRRVARCHQAMQGAKRRHQLVPAPELLDLTLHSAPVLSTAAIRLASRVGLARRILPFNVVISNVPGPRQPLYFAGSRLCHQFPVSIVTDGLGLNITVMSYLDRLDFGVIVDRELVPDVWDLAGMFTAEITRLLEATGAEPA
jgi:WS/DGAT/MGAT family acyltransferase